MHRVLVIRFSSIGDIVLTSPVLRRLKQAHGKDVEIHYLTKAAFSGLVEHNPHVTKVWRLEERLEAIIPELLAQDFTHILDLHSNLRSAKVKRALSTVPNARLNKHNWAKWLAVNLNIDRLPDANIVERYTDVASELGVEDDGEGLDFFFPAGFIPAYPKPIPAEPYMAWVVGAAHRGKHLGPEKTARVLDRLNIPVILLGGPGEKDMAEYITRSCQRPLVNMVAKTDLFSSAKLISESTLVVSPDTGMMHIAAAMGKRVISLWGCTTPRFGMSPYRAAQGSVMIEPLGLSRRPCSKLGDRCQYPGWCIEQIDEDELVTLIQSTWN